MRERTTRTQEVVDSLLDAIVSGELADGAQLPAEADLADRFGVSRLTLREGLRLLQAQGVVVPVPGSRHRIAPAAEWTGLEAVVRHSRSAEAREQSSLELLEMRVMFEVGAAELAAARRSERDVEELNELLVEMRSAHAADDVDRFVDADLAFHDVIFRAAVNRILVASVRPLTRLLHDTRAETSAIAQIRDHAIAEHERIVAALQSGSPEAARAAMTSHMSQTREDLQKLVLGGR